MFRFAQGFALAFSLIGAAVAGEQIANGVIAGYMANIIPCALFLGAYLLGFSNK
jgi:hypothetical protein